MNDSYVLNAILKGIIEGVTEFLPVSSTGHLILARDWFPLTGGSPADAKRLNDLFDIVIQFPAVLAIVILFRAKLWTSVRSIHADVGAQKFWGGLVLAFVPAAIVGVLLKDSIEKHLMHPAPVAVALIVGGLILILIERARRDDAAVAIVDSQRVPLGTAVMIGVCQCFGMIPGTSRSGATIVGGRLLGLSRAAAAEFSFFLALPTMGAAFGYKFLSAYAHINWSQDGIVLLWGCLASFVSAAVVVYGFMRVLERYKNALLYFGVYRIVLGAIVLLAMK